MIKEFINKRVFDKDAEQKATREGYGEGLVELGKHNEKVVALCADLTDSTQVAKFAKEYPKRFFEIGVAEQNMATIAAGMGVSGKIPFISSYATFSPGRNYEQIRTTIAYNNSNVKIAGHHAGISTGPDGATHQATEDIAIMRVMPNMKVIVPCDAIEARKATMAAAHIYGPVYLRFTREKTPMMTTEETPFAPGRAYAMWDTGKAKGKNKMKPEVLFVGCGPILHEALKVAKDLAEKDGVGSLVVNSHTIKPLDEKFILDAAKECGAVVTIEEHQKSGGLGGAVAELLAQNNPLPIEMVGLHDTYAESGQPSELMEKYCLSARHIKAAAKKVLNRKKKR